MSIYADIDEELGKRLDNATDDNGWVLNQILSEHSDSEIDSYRDMLDIHCEMITEGWSDEVTKEVDKEIVRRYDRSKSA